MSLGGNLSSGYTDSLTDKAVQAGMAKVQSAAFSDKGCSEPVSQKVASYPSMVLISKICASNLTPAQFACYPKVAIPSSVRTQAITDVKCSNTFDPVSRFAKYQRYQVPTPCLPLTPLANSAGISKPSILKCNIYPK